MQRQLARNYVRPIVRILLFMTSYVMQCERMFREGCTQIFRANNIYVCVSQPDLLDYRGYIKNLSTMFPRPELGLQMLRDFQV